MSDDARDARSALLQKVQQLRRERGLTVAELGERAGIDPPQLDCLLEGSAEIGVSVFARLAAALSVDPEELLAGILWVPDGKGGGEYRVKDPDGD